MSTRFWHNGRCSFCYAGPQFLPVPGHEFARFYCDEECRSYAHDVPHCSVAGCRGPADHTFTDYHRCEACAPGGCRTCTVWGKESCAAHRAPAANRNGAPRYRPEVKLLCGEHPIPTPQTIYVAARLALAEYFQQAPPPPSLGPDDDITVRRPVPSNEEMAAELGRLEAERRAREDRIAAELEQQRRARLGSVA